MSKFNKYGIIICLLLLSFCIFKIANCQIRPDNPEPARPVADTTFNKWIIEVPKETYKKLVLIDSLQKELLKCQEKSKVDEIIIERLFECVKNKGVTILTKGCPGLQD